MLVTVLLGTGFWGDGAATRVKQVSATAQPTAAAGTEHPEIPDTEGATCVQCHDDIGKKKVVHGAVSAGLCAGCHAFIGQGDQMRVALAESATRDTMAAVCVTCHEEVGTAMKASHAHPALADGNCLLCHQPHESDEPTLLNAPQSDMCVTCHDSIGADLQRKTPHVPAQTACSACHDPHGGANDTQLRDGLNGLCLTCHSASAPSLAQPPRLFGREVSEPVAALMQPAKRIALDALLRSGHPIVGHPVRGPRDPLVPGRPFSCVSCHTPHGSDHPALIRFTFQDPSEVCVKCHT